MPVVYTKFAIDVFLNAFLYCFTLVYFIAEDVKFEEAIEIAGKKHFYIT